MLAPTCCAGLLHAGRDFSVPALRAPRRQLHRDKEVLFAGYKLPHPLEYRMLVKVQTRGRRTPRDVVDAALTDLVDEFVDMKAKFQARTAGW